MRSVPPVRRGRHRRLSDPGQPSSVAGTVAVLACLIPHAAVVVALVLSWWVQ